MVEKADVVVSPAPLIAIGNVFSVDGDGRRGVRNRAADGDSEVEEVDRTSRAEVSAHTVD